MTVFSDAGQATLSTELQHRATEAKRALLDTSSGAHHNRSHTCVVQGRGTGSTCELYQSLRLHVLRLRGVRSLAVTTAAG